MTECIHNNRDATEGIVGVGATYLNALRLYATSCWTLRVHMRRSRKTPFPYWELTEQGGRRGADEVGYIRRRRKDGSPPAKIDFSNPLLLLR